MFMNDNGLIAMTLQTFKNNQIQYFKTLITTLKDIESVVIFKKYLKHISKISNFHSFCHL